MPSTCGVHVSLVHDPQTFLLASIYGATAKFFLLCAPVSQMLFLFFYVIFPDLQQRNIAYTS